MIEYNHHSPSSLNLFAAEPALWVLQYLLGEKSIANSRMCRGTAVEKGVAWGLMDTDASEDDCIKVALKDYDTRMALSVDKRKEETRKGLPAMVKQALAALRPYGEPLGLQGFVEFRPEDLKRPIIGYYDFLFSARVVDLKTTEKMPSEISIPHARQVACYLHNHSNFGAELCYVTPKRCEVYSLENLNEHRQAMINIAVTVENLLSLSKDPMFFVGITVPNLDSYFWNDPRLRQRAYEIWQI